MIKKFLRIKKTSYVVFTELLNAMHSKRKKYIKYV